MDIVGTLFDVALKLFGLRAEMARARQERREQVAEFLVSVGANIKGVSESLQRGEYPHGSCQKLLTHAQALPATIGDLVGQAQADELASHLREVWQIERLYSELDHAAPPERERKLHVLEQTAGLLEATAEVIKASK